MLLRCKGMPFSNFYVIMLTHTHQDFHCRIPAQIVSSSVDNPFEVMHKSKYSTQLFFKKELFSVELSATGTLTQ